MALADASGANAPYDLGQGVDDLARQVFPDNVGEGYPVDPDRLADAFARRQDRKTRHIDTNPTEVKLPSSYGELVIAGSKPSSFGESLSPSGLRSPTCSGAQRA